MLELLAAAFLIPIAISDAGWRLIPKGLTLAAAAAGLIFHGIYGGLGSALLTMVAGFIIATIFYGLGAIGGGDVKLIAAVGALLGWSLWLTAMEFAIFVAAGMALVQMIYRGAVRQTLRNMGALLVSWSHGGIHSGIHVANPNTIRSPFAVAAAVGVFAALNLH
jgi:prepilin peptidase CpaA